MNTRLETKLFRSGFTTVAGLDEVGIGALAGPVVASCMVVSEKTIQKIRRAKFREAIRDSKLLSEKKREELFAYIQNFADEVKVGIVKHTTVDRMNVYRAGVSAMEQALARLSRVPDYILVDGRVKLASTNGNQKSIIDGDAKIFTIACASIVAKVTRDRLMRTYHEKFPHYGFDQHKGYATKLHLAKLAEHGPCTIHRTTYAPVKQALQRRALSV